MSILKQFSILHKKRASRMKRKVERFEIRKTRIAELLAIVRKRRLYGSVKWTKEQQTAFDAFWKNYYGKKIPNWWHRLYEATSGCFAIDYIPEFLYTIKIEPLLVDRWYAIALEDKSMVETLCVGLPVRAPKSLLLRSNGRFYDENRLPVSLEEAVSLISGKAPCIMKPSNGSSSGHGITIIDHLSASDASCLLEQSQFDFIIQERIDQHPVFAAFNPSSVNTIRLTTYYCEERICHMPICFRIGRSGSAVDNIHAGGLVIGVQDDGSLLPKAYELGYGDKNKSFTAHPDSGVVFSEMQLPGISEMIQAAYLLHGRYPHIGVISWDFTLDAQGKPVLIEANIVGQSIWICQMIHGKGALGDNTKAILKLLKRN